MRAMVFVLIAATTLLAEAARVSQAGQPVSGQDAAAPESFFGPFASWTDLKSAYGAIGDGVADDTDALQRALGDLEAGRRSPVLYLPAGRYRLTRTVTLSHVSNVAIVGEHPETTTLVWDGNDSGVMLEVNGVAYSRVARLGFDGRRRARVAVDQSWDGLRPHFDTGNEYADDWFVDVGYGIRGGFRGHGFAETTVIRAAFIRNAEAGIALGNFNALNLWVWRSRFDDCAVGVTNEGGAGNFHVYESAFRRSTRADLSMANTGGFSARRNYSSDSRMFLIAAGSNNPATIHLQQNVVVRPLITAIEVRNQGPLLLTDNVVIGRADASAPVVLMSNLFGADVASVNNTFTVADPIATNGHLLSIDDRVVVTPLALPPEPALTPTSGRRDIPVIDVPAGATAEMIQQTIARAVARRVPEVVVHIPAGVHQIDRTLRVPARGVRLMGDGFDSVLRWTGAAGQPVLRLEGPSHAVISDLRIEGGGAGGNGIEIEKVDQPGGRVTLRQVQLRHARQADLEAERLNHTTVVGEDIGVAYSPNQPSVRVGGGPGLAAGSAAGGRLMILSGAGSGNRVTFAISGGARLDVRDFWYESGAGPGFARVTGRSMATFDGLRVSSPLGTAGAAFVVDSSSRATILATHFDDRLEPLGAGADLVGLALFCARPASECVAGAASSRIGTVIVGSKQASPVALSGSLRWENTPGEWDARLRSVLAEVRAIAGSDRERSQEQTDVTLLRVWIEKGEMNLTLSP